jgi:hypothetical protein
VQLEFLYRVRFTYSGGWGADLSGPDNPEGQFFFSAEGRCEGRISGRFRGANHSYRRGDGTFLPDFQGVIETDDGAEVLFDYRGYGPSSRPYSHRSAGKVSSPKFSHHEGAYRPEPESSGLHSQG